MGESPDTVRSDGEAVAAEPEANGDPTPSSSTVQLRVRDVDSRTTSLRLPVDNATTALRLPAEAAEPVEPAAKGGDDSSDGDADGDPDGDPGADSGAEGAESAVDPRLAMRDEKKVADAEPQSEPEPEPESEPVPEAGAEPEPMPVLAPVLEPAIEPALKPEPAPEPTPVPQLTPTPVPQLTPGPQSPPSPPSPPPAPAPSPLPPPGPAPLSMPETTSEAMEVLAALSARPVSPFRRAVKRTTIWTLFLAVVLGIVVTGQLLRPLPGPRAKLSLAASYTFGGDALALPWPAKGQAVAEVVGVGPLGSSGPETPAPIASVTKVMNAFLVLQDHPLKKGESGPVLTVDKQAASESSDADQSRVTLTEGQKITQYEALEMLMLPSANNVARLLARWDAGSEEAFVKKMNDQAAKLGMANTTYVDPAGYNADTKSTAKDQLKLAEQVMQIEIFRQIVAEPDTNFNNQRVYNTNYLLSPKNGVIGVKTGSSSPAGSCLMWAATKDIGATKRLILGVTLGQPATGTDNILKAAQTVSQKIITASQDSLTGQTLAKQGDVVGYVDDGLGGKVPVVAAQDVTVAGWKGITANLTLDPAKLGHSAKAGTQVGTVSAGEGDGKVEVPVTLQSDLAPPSIMSRLLRLL